MSHMPRHLCILVVGLFLKTRGVASLVDFKQVENYARVQVILTTVVNREMKQHVRHSFLRNVLEVLKRQSESLVVDRTVVTQINKHFPRLNELVAMQ